MTSHGEDDSLSLTHPIPFHRIALTGKEYPYLLQAIQNGRLSGDGIFTQRCQRYFEENLGVEKALLTTSGTHALELAALLLEIRPGDEVILPSFAFPSDGNAFALRGAQLVFADIRPDTLNLDEGQLEKLIRPKTKALLVVHYAGIACEMDRILEIASRHGVAVIEDNAHGLFASYRRKSLGTLGVFGVQSFHDTKNFICGEGGALFINDPFYGRRAEVLREKGTNRSEFLQGLTEQYVWEDLGSSYLPSDLLAAFLWAQLEAREIFQRKRQFLWETYARELESWGQAEGVKLPTVPEGCEQPYHTFYLLMPHPAARRELMEELKQKGMMTTFHFLPLHLSPMGRKLGGKPGDCPVTEKVSGCLLRLPLFPDLSSSEQERIIERIQTFRCPR